MHFLNNHYEIFLYIPITLCVIFTGLTLISIDFDDVAGLKNDSYSGDSYWTSEDNMPDTRNELTAVELDDLIYVMGGEDIASGGDQKSSIEVYDISKEKWIKKDIAPLPIPLDHTASAVYDDKIYVAGGFLERKVPTDKLFIYDIKKNKWKEGHSLPTPIGAALGAEFVNGTMYIIGGVNASQAPVNSNFAYDPKTDSWEIKSPMPTARHHLQIVSIDEKIFALGGRILGDGIRSEDIDPTLTNFDRNEMYDPKTNKWTVKEPMLTKRSGFAAAVPEDGNIYVFGGQGVRKVENRVEKYDPKLDKWTFEKNMPLARYGIKAVPYGDKIYIFGGQVLEPEKIPLNLNQVFHIGKK